MQSFVETFPPTVEVEGHEIGSGGFDPTAPAARLSDRQREAVLVALELGYYESPKAATHADVTAELGCAPGAASERLQKAEATLVREAMRGPTGGA